MNDNAFLKSRRTGIFKDMSNGTICIPKDLRDNNGLSSNSFFDILYRNGRNFGVAKQPKPKTETVSKYCTLFNADKENVLFTSEKKGEENG